MVEINLYNYNIIIYLFYQRYNNFIDFVMSVNISRLCLDFLAMRKPFFWGKKQSLVEENQRRKRFSSECGTNYNYLMPKSLFQQKFQKQYSTDEKWWKTFSGGKKHQQKEEWKSAYCITERTEFREQVTDDEASIDSNISSPSADADDDHVHAEIEEQKNRSHSFQLPVCHFQPSSFRIYARVCYNFSSQGWGSMSFFYETKMQCVSPWRETINMEFEGSFLPRLSCSN